MAEAVFNHLLEQAGQADEWEVDSAGTGSWHIGKKPDPRTLEICRLHSIPINCRGRQLQAGDLQDFDYILVMDRQNLANVQAMASQTSTAQVELLALYDVEANDEVDDLLRR